MKMFLNMSFFENYQGKSTLNFFLIPSESFEAMLLEGCVKLMYSLVFK